MVVLGVRHASHCTEVAFHEGQQPTGPVSDDMQQKQRLFNGLSTSGQIEPSNLPDRRAVRKASGGLSRLSLIFVKRMIVLETLHFRRLSTTSR
jgi:hypothetical protein